MNTPRVLLVDDERDIAEALSFALQTRGLEVEVVHDGDAALDRAREDPPDLMVLDVMLPGINGYELSRQLKDWMEGSPQGRSFPILLITARRVSSGEREEFLGVWSRADGVLYKPFELEELHAQVQRLLARAMEAAAP
jgi:DNA-binding response OmpR family regulator